MNAKDLQKNGVYIGKNMLFPKKTVQKIIDNLANDEKIIKITTCNSGKEPGAIAVTNKKIIFASKVLFNATTTEFGIDKITSVSYDTGLVNKLIIKSSFDTLILTAIDKKAGQILIKEIKAIQSQQKINETNNSGSNLDELEKLAELKEKGIITEEDFNQKKKQILGL